MDKFCCMLYGESGVGKTPFCGTLEEYPKTSPSLFLDVDQGAMSLNVVNPRPVVHSVMTWAGAQTVYALLKGRKWEELSKLVGAPAKEYRSVVVDSGTELSRILRESIVAADDRNEGVPSQEHYLRAQLRFTTMYRMFRDLPMSFVMTAGVRELKDDVAGIVKFYPDFPPGMTHDLIRMSDLVLFMNVALEQQQGSSERKWVRYLVTQVSQRFVARDRSQTLDPTLRSGSDGKFKWSTILDKVLK